MMSEEPWEKRIVWETAFEMKTQNVKSIDWHSSRGGKDEMEALQRKLDFADELMRGHAPVDPSTAPDYAYFALQGIPRKQRDNLPDLCIVRNGVFFVSEAFRDLLSGFNIGQTQFLEVPLFEFDQKTPRPGRWFFLNIVEKKDTLVPEQCEELTELPRKGYFSMPPRDKPPFIALREEAASGVELWYEERLHSRFFLSDRLKCAIKAEKMKIRNFPLQKAVLVR